MKNSNTNSKRVVVSLSDLVPFGKATSSSSSTTGNNSGKNSNNNEETPGKTVRDPPSAPSSTKLTPATPGPKTNGFFFDLATGTSSSSRAKKEDKKEREREKARSAWCDQFLDFPQRDQVQMLSRLLETTTSAVLDHSVIQNDKVRRKLSSIDPKVVVPPDLRECPLDNLISQSNQSSSHSVIPEDPVNPLDRIGPAGTIVSGVLGNGFGPPFTVGFRGDTDTLQPADEKTVSIKESPASKSLKARLSQHFKWKMAKRSSSGKSLNASCSSLGAKEGLNGETNASVGDTVERTVTAVDEERMIKQRASMEIAFEDLVDRQFEWGGVIESEDMEGGFNVLMSEKELLALDDPGEVRDTPQVLKAWATVIGVDSKSPDAADTKGKRGDSSSASLSEAADVQFDSSKLDTLPRDTLRDMVYKYGLPVKERVILWTQWRGVISSKTEIERKKEFLNYLKQVPDRLSPDLRRQIDVDIPRTLAKVLKSDTQQTCLRNVLQVYALYNPDVGYCQSMNILVGVMLYANVYPWDIIYIIDDLIKHLCTKYHYQQDGMTRLMTDMAVVEKLMQEFCPVALQRIQACGLDVMFFAVDPFLCLFGHTLPLKSLLRVWDVLLLEGEVMLFALFMALLALTQHVIDDGTDVPEPETIISKWTTSIRRQDAGKILSKTREYIDSGAISIQKIQALREQVYAEENVGVQSQDSQGNLNQTDEKSVQSLTEAKLDSKSLMEPAKVKNKSSSSKLNFFSKKKTADDFGDGSSKKNGLSSATSGFGAGSLFGSSKKSQQGSPVPTPVLPVAVPMVELEDPPEFMFAPVAHPIDPLPSAKVSEANIKEIEV